MTAATNQKQHSEEESWTADSFNGMPYRLLGRSGLRVPNLGIGTWKFGRPELGDGSRVNEKAAHRIFDRAIELGATFWDTANRYHDGSGNSERVIGSWLKSNPDQRRNVIVATKIFAPMDGNSPNHSRLSRGNILESVYACLERLNCQVIDLLYFHMHDPLTPVEESLAAIEDLVRQDLVRYFGVSNFNPQQLARYQAVAADLSVRCRIQAVQNRYDILNGEDPQRPGVLNYCAGNDVAFIAWTPLLGGLLTGKYLDHSKVKKGDRLLDEGTMAILADERTMALIRRLSDLGSAWGLTLNELVIAYMLTLPAMGPVIAAVSNPQQLEANARGARTPLDREQTNRVAKILRATDRADH